ncbi:MAG: hypothetical protein HC945_04495, partial [Nitrosarchaeum sp.]|nr:hypothetical protein [Nitrosarchaeum sp.]
MHNTKHDRHDKLFTAQHRDCTAFCAGLLGNTTTNTSTPKHEIQGTVTDQSNQPIEDAQVYAYFPYSSYGDITNNQGEFILRGVPQGSDVGIYARHPECQPGQTTLPSLDRDLAGITLQLDCTRGGCVKQDPIITSITAVRGEGRNTITWEYLDSCQDLQTFIVLRCDTSFQDCVGYPVPDHNTFTDPPQGQGTLANETHCYLIKAVHYDGETTESALTETNCVSPGDSLCLQPHSPQFCHENSVKTCDENNHIVDVESCSSTQVCTLDYQYGQPTGEASCKEQPPCEQCNAPLYGLFALYRP